MLEIWKTIFEIIFSTCVCIVNYFKIICFVLQLWKFCKIKTCDLFVLLVYLYY